MTTNQLSEGRESNPQAEINGDWDPKIVELNKARKTEESNPGLKLIQ